MPASKTTEADFLAAWNDPARFPLVEDVANHVGVTSVSCAKRACRLRKKHGSKVLDRAQHQRHERNAEAFKTTGAKTASGVKRKVIAPPARIDRWIVTSAQDETPVAEPFWSNMLALAEHYNAEIKVGGFTYQKGLFEDHASRTAVFASKVQEYMVHENEWLGPLMFAAKMNILPTAVKPLSGLETYSRGADCIFPHAKRQLTSVPAIQGQHPAMVQTSGTCTIPNYIEKKAGLKAEFHHAIGCTIVEVDDQGRVFTRQVDAANDGTIQDLDVIVRNGKVTTGNRVEQITWGDIHREKLDPSVAMACWGLDLKTDEIVTEETMFHTLKPRHQAFHDLLDFMARNHHNRGSHQFLFEMIQGGTDSVEAGIRSCALFLRRTATEWCKSMVVPSNHNDALPRWLREADPRADPVNLRTWCHLNDRLYTAIEEGDQDFDIIRYAMARHDDRELEDIAFPPRNGSYVVCQEHGGIECAMHGDQGPNGARGTASNLVKVATRMNVGHAHSASILDGVYVAGLSGLMDQGYNSGPSGWSHTHIVTYGSSKRTLVTLKDGKWRA